MTALRPVSLLVLGLVLVFAWADRMLITVTIEAIKHEFVLSDVQMGLLLGPAFAIFYAGFALPIARWADIGHRPRIISLALSMWSVMTLLSGLAVNFVQLFVARVGVGIGEAGAHPPVHSLVADYCPPDKRGRAASVLNFCIVVGAFVGLSLGGFLVAQLGWRWAFASFGIAGILVDKLARRHVKWLLLLPAICFVVNAPLRIVAFQSDDTGVFAVCYFMMVAMMCINNPATYAATYGIAGTGRIATAMAVVGLATNVIGLGLGPLFIGLLSDLLEPQFGAESLRYALTGAAAITMIAGLWLMLGARHVATDFEGPRPDMNGE